MSLNDPEAARPRTAPGAAGNPALSELTATLARFRGAFLAVAGFSGMINILMLSGSLFMLQVYDRVLPSRSVPTFVAIVIFVAMLFLIQGLLDSIRGHLLARIGSGLDNGCANAPAASCSSCRSSGDVPARRSRDRRKAWTRSGDSSPAAVRRLVRSAVDAALSRAVLQFPSLARSRRIAGAGVLVALALLTEARVRSRARRLAASRQREASHGAGKHPQCGGGGGHGHGGPASPCAGPIQSRNIDAERCGQAT